MEIAEMLDELKKKALEDPLLRQELLDTRKSPTPVASFCEKCRSCGYPIYEMDLIAA